MKKGEDFRKTKKEKNSKHMRKQKETMNFYESKSIRTKIQKQKKKRNKILKKYL